jgi:hypothetical protein
MTKKTGILIIGAIGVMTALVLMSGNKILSYAQKWLGVYEKGNNQGWDNKKLEKLMVSYGFKKGWEYCSLFVKMVLGQTLTGEKREFILSLIDPSSLTTWNNFVNNAKKTKYYTISQKPVPGALVYYERNRAEWKGHAEIVEKVYANGFTAVSGNSPVDGTKEGIARRKRSFKSSEGFKRLGYVIIH